MYVSEATHGTSEVTRTLLVHSGERVCENSPSFLLLLVHITMFGCRKQVWEAVAIERCCWRAESLELLGVLHYTAANSQTLHKAKKHPTP